MGILSNLLRPGPAPITAAIVSGADSLDTAAPSRMSREATDAWKVWRCVGEIRYATTQQARLVGRVEWTVSVNGQEVDDSESLMAEAFGDNLRDLQVKAALHLQVAGAYKLARMRPNDPTSWDVVSHPVKHSDKRKLENADVIVTVENNDPDDEGRPDSPVIGALDVARELILARGQSRAAARSRTAQLQTILYPLEGAGPDPKTFEKNLIDVMVAPLQDEMSTASVAPNLVGFSGEHIDQWREIDMTGPIDEKLHERIERLVRSLAVQLDAPPEILLGMGDVNHWGQWGIQEDNWLGHVEPLAAPIGRGFAEAIRRISGVEDIAIAPDPANLLKRRPTLTDALRAYELGIVNDEWAREQLGASDEDAGPGREVETAQSEDEAPASAEPDEPQVSAVEPLPISAERLAAIDDALFDAMTDTVTDATDRLLERVGAQLRSAAQGKDIDLPDVPNAELAVAYEGDIPNLPQTIESTARQFVPRVERVIARAYRHTRMAGVPVEPDERQINDGVALFVSNLGEMFQVRRSGQTGKAEAWRLAHRVVDIAAGNPDPAVTAAPGLGNSAVRGVALGVRALDAMRAEYDIIAAEWRWQHNTSGPNAHPEHEDLDGRVFQPGSSILEHGVNWYPGDHAGCRCTAVPVLVRQG